MTIHIAEKSGGVTRRAAIAGLVTSAVAGCVPETPGRAYSRKPWVAPRIAPENVIREIVGHRPFRPGGFVVRADALDSKLLVHNYGHGGGGVSLAWGSSALAVREVDDRPVGTVAVIGSGVMGLTSARLLQDAGWQATIYTRDVARHTTSNVAGGQWAPFSVYDPAVATDAFKAQLRLAARISHHAYTNLGGSGYGVRWLEQYALSRESRKVADEPGELDSFFPYAKDLPPGEHPFGEWHARRSVTMLIDPGTLLRSLVRDFRAAGGKFVIRNFADASQVLALKEGVIFNCTGLGSASLFGDSSLVPAKGQLVLLPPDPGVDYMTMGGGEGQLYMFPRTDVLLLGGTFKPGDYSLHPEPEETERILAEHARLFAGFG